MRRAARVAGILLAVGIALGGAGGLWLRGRVVASLPQLDGDRPLHGLGAAVAIARDARGVPTLRGETRRDLATALGFLHAQERFFQMDLLRRSAAGELAELFGPAAVKQDRKLRLHRFRDVARRVVADADDAERGLVEAYTAGVNAGLAALGAQPFEYLLLGVDPAPWRPEDSALAILAMFLVLQDESGRRESRLGYMADTLPPELFAFLAPRGTEWDAPIVGPSLETAAIPGPDVFDLRRQPVAPPKAAHAAAGEDEADDSDAGSNNWAIAGSRTADGRAILANDMHLDVAVPNTWYRASLVWSDAGAARRVTGVTLPGTVSVAVGSNGHVAWGFTNSYGDWGDLVVLEPVAGDADAYLTLEGPRRFQHVAEIIRVKGRPDETLDVVETIWGPVIDTDAQGRRRALRWVAHDPAAVNLHSLGLESAGSLVEAQAVANRSGIPAQNFVCVDAQGHIGWTIMGRMPRRVGFDGRLPTSWADGVRRWDGWLAPDEYPRVVDPEGGQIWTANARVVDGAMLAKVGDGGYDLGARARQIRDDLRALAMPAEKDMLPVQLDDRALFLARWQKLLLDVLAPAAVAADPRRGELRRLVESWGGRAAVDSAGYRLVRTYRSLVRAQVETPFARAFKHNDDPRFAVGFQAQAEGPLWALVSQRPPHLLDPAFKSWDEALLAAADATIEQLTRDGRPLERQTWGARNSPRIQHPLARALSFLSPLIDMPTLPIPGDSNMPRVQDLGEGASERLAVSPGHESDGYFMMPCGQSGHPLSPHYGDGHRDWVEGRPVSFLPGPAVHTLRLVPGT